MDITVKGKNLTVTPALRRHVERKLGKLSRYFEDLTEMTATLSVEKERHIVEVTAPLNGGMILRGEEETPDMYASVDRVADKLERQVRKHKTRLARRHRPGGNKEQAVPEASRPPVEEAEEEPRIVRTKRFAVKPMPAEEAVLQMELLGHDFFVFYNGDTEEVNVVYRRRDGNYGLIEPVYGED